MRHYVRCQPGTSVTTHSTTHAHPPSHVHAPSKSFLLSLSQATGCYNQAHTPTPSLYTHERSSRPKTPTIKRTSSTSGTRMQARATIKRLLMTSFLRILAKYVVVFCRVVFCPQPHPLPFLLFLLHVDTVHTRLTHNLLLLIINNTATIVISL